MKAKVISLQYYFQVLYVLCFTRPRYQVSVYRTIGSMVLFLCSLPDDDQCDIGSEQDGPDDLDDDTHNDNKHKPGAYPDNDLNCHDMENDNQSDTESNDSDTNSGKGEGEKEQIVNELSDTDMNKTTRTRSGIEDKTSNGRCRKRSDEDLSQEVRVYGRRTDKLRI